MTPTDDEIHAMLAARADRVTASATEAGALLTTARELAAAEPRASRNLLRLTGTMPRLLAGVASVVAAVLVVALVAMPLANRPPASAVPSVSSSSGTGPTELPTAPTATSAPEVRVLTPQELAGMVKSRGPRLAGLVVALEGELVRDRFLGCRDGATCSNTTIVGAADAFVVKPVGDIGPGPWDGSGPRSGTFALRLTDERIDGGRLVADYLGDIRPAAKGLTWSVDDLVAGKAREEGGFVAVRGWLVRTPLHSCPSVAGARGIYGCPTDDYLTAERFQPLNEDGSSTGPDGGLYLPSGTYDEWAPSPTVFGLGVEPREATYLLAWTGVAPCGPLADCFVGPENFHWLVRGHLDPIPTDVSEEPVEPAPDTGYYPGGIPRSIDGEPVLVGLDTQRRLADATDDTSFLAGGFTWYGPAMCGGGIGPRDPNPLASDACPRYRIAGVPGRLFVPTGRLEVGDVPLVVRVHTRDPGAETCWPQNVEMCRTSVVLAVVVWQGDEATKAVPLGPREAIGRALNIWIGDRRTLADGSISYVDEPRFAMPISCPAPWPALVYELRGDPRLGLLAVFGDQAARTAFEVSVEPSAGASCLNSAIDRLDPPRWISQDNLLVLAYADDPTAAEIAAQLGWVEGAQRNTIALPAASIDRSRETLLDYLDSRAAGPSVTSVNGEVPSLNFGPVPTHPDGNPAINVSAGWSQDVLRRFEANALDGVVEPVTDAPTTAQLGDAAAIVESTGAARVWLYRVTYPGSTDPRLATEQFAIVQIPGSTFRDWGIVRVTGEPFPIVPIPVPEPGNEHPFPSGVILPILP